MSDPRFELPMTREVLSDCKVAVAQLKEGPKGQKWRIQWVGMLALLRTVADTFNEEAKRGTPLHPNLKKELEGFWGRMAASKPKPDIYWSFIRDDTNNLLHYWKFAAAHHLTEWRDDMIMSTEKWSAQPTRIHSVDTSREHKGFTPGSTYLMKSGPFAGQDQRDVVQKAIEWYEQEIADMNKRANP